MRFQRNRVIDDHHSIIWFGDFNYRIGMKNEDVRMLIKEGDLETLYKNDQLSIQMIAGNVFRYYSEGRITFPPTYKYDIGTDTYDTSEKARVPAWCDRVLYKGTNIKLLQYYAAPLMFSDHRPVYATFECIINVVDEETKESIRKEAIYRQKNALEDYKSEDDDSEDLLEYDSIDAHLPPASTDRRKWWLDQKHPSRSKVEIPDYMSFDPLAKPNPFSQENRPSVPESAPSFISGSSSSDLATLNNVASAPTIPMSERKKRPPIPKKPPSMRSLPQYLNTQPLQPHVQESSLPLRAASTRNPRRGAGPPPTPAPRKTYTMPTGRTQNPAPMPRQTTGLLDDDSEPTLSWKPLQPR
ncbi:Synaptojanin-2 [Ascosphaera pollenicola]|nr:Synaptojanin-2 [Ascosphaera pollenicola]